MKIYIDTSVFDGVFDTEFAKPSKELFEEISLGKFALVTSAIVAAEIEPAPDNVKKLFSEYSQLSEVVEVTQEILNLQSSYVNANIVTEKSIEDALHVAIATVSKCDMIISWNFKHIVHFDKIPKYNAVNVLNGYNNIGIYSPQEIIKYAN